MQSAEGGLAGFGDAKLARGASYQTPEVSGDTANEHAHHASEVDLGLGRKKSLTAHIEAYQCKDDESPKGWVAPGNRYVAVQRQSSNEPGQEEAIGSRIHKALRKR